MDETADHVGVKGSITPLHIALDAVAVLTGFLGWVLILWMPFVLAGVCLIEAKRQEFDSGNIVVASVIEAIVLPVGILLCYLARGIIKRAKIRIALVTLFFTIWGTFLLIHLPGQDGFHAIQICCQSIVFLSAAIICLLALAKSREALNAE